MKVKEFLNVLDLKATEKEKNHITLWKDPNTTIDSYYIENGKLINSYDSNFDYWGVNGNSIEQYFDCEIVSIKYHYDLFIK